MSARRLTHRRAAGPAARCRYHTPITPDTPRCRRCGGFYPTEAGNLCQDCAPKARAEGAAWVVGSAAIGRSAPRDVDVVYRSIDAETASTVAADWVAAQPILSRTRIELHRIPHDGPFIALAEHEPVVQIWGAPQPLPRTVPHWTGTAIRYWLRYGTWPIWARGAHLEAREHDAAIVMAVDEGRIDALRAAMAPGAWARLMAGDARVTLAVQP